MLLAPFFTAPKFYAIPMEDNRHRHWDYSNDVHSSLVYEWRDVEYYGKGKLEDVFIAVAKTYPDYSPEKIKGIARAIKTYPVINKGDGILGISGYNRISRIGRVASKAGNPKDREINIIIDWQQEIETAVLEKGLFYFDPGLEIQTVGKRIISALNLPIQIDEYLAESMAFTRKEIPKSDLEHFEFLEEEPKEDKGGKVHLFYGTNRNDTGSAKVNDKYGDELSDLKFGFCEVSIPRGHQQGEIERPFDVWDIEILPENANRHIVLNSITETTEKEFFERVSGDLARLAEQSAMVFIHGYNNTFTEAARRAAQIKYDVPFNGLAGFYSWPSGGKLLDYLKDIEKADATIPCLEEFIEKFVVQTQVEKLHLIAHSMGNRLLTTTLNNLSNKQTFQTKLRVFNQIILAAPDLDQNVFKNVILPRFQSIGDRRTLYASDKDKALNQSERFRRGLARLGDAGDDLFVDSGLDTVDASNVPSGGNNHSYIFETKELLTDLFLLLDNGSPPLKRRLRARVKNNLSYWLFPR